MSNSIIIAEAGVNHNGDLKIAKEMCRVAARAGANIIKFQTFKAVEVATKYVEKANYQKLTSSKNESQLEMLKKLELSYDAHLELINECENQNIQFLSTAFDLDSIKLLNKLNIEYFKVPSGEITNLPYLREIGKSGKKIIMSTGMSNLKEISDAINTILKEGLKKDMITVLHCTTEYPTPYNEVNLNAMLTIKDKFDINVGYSDHSLGIEIPIAAVALGATLIEKHFTLNRNFVGPDHSASIEPEELKYMVNSIRNVELAMGNGYKKASLSERKNINSIRKSIVAKIPIKKGEKFSSDNLTVKRPGTGITPMMWDKLIGQNSNKSYLQDELIEL